MIHASLMRRGPAYLVAIGCGAGAGQQQGERRALQLLAHLPQEVSEGATWRGGKAAVNTTVRLIHGGVRYGYFWVQRSFMHKGF